MGWPYFISQYPDNSIPMIKKYFTWTFVTLNLDYLVCFDKGHLTTFRYQLFSN